MTSRYIVLGNVLRPDPQVPPLCPCQLDGLVGHQPDEVGKHELCPNPLKECCFSKSP